MDIVKTLISDSYPLVILIIVCMIFFFPGRIDIFLSVLKRHINKISKEGVLFCSVNEPHDNTPPIARSLDKKEEEIYDELAKNYLENDVGCKIFATLWKHQIAFVLLPIHSPLFEDTVSMYPCNKTCRGLQEVPLRK